MKFHEGDGKMVLPSQNDNDSIAESTSVDGVKQHWWFDHWESLGRKNSLGSCRWKNHEASTLNDSMSRFTGHWQSIFMGPNYTIVMFDNRRIFERMMYSEDSDGPLSNQKQAGLARVWKWPADVASDEFPIRKALGRLRGNIRASEHRGNVSWLEMTGFEGVI